MKLKRFLLIIFICNPILLFSQIRAGWGGDAAMYTNYDYGTFMGHYSIARSWLMNRNFSVSLGAMFSYARLDLPGLQTADAHYYFDDEYVGRLNVLTSATYTLPIFKIAGIYASASAFAEPIPFNYIGIEKHTATSIDKSKGKFVFTRFTPGAFIDVGIYTDCKKNDGIFKIFVGVGYGWHDPVPDYRNARFDGQKLSAGFSDKKNMYRITIKIMGF
ncbi:hypothetical protein [Bacteroides sp. 519]|uniref:hypothetical protein n=1 Tax=Bacteroides sp. 519 TaxID=2302937 RepID=UPI0013D24837|nr:hypothetical protein [Bacteroides sp. 519]NDV57710.1 hypothetical protein [Bacteroides sp. 519]